MGGFGNTGLSSQGGLNLPLYDRAARAWDAGTFTETWTYSRSGVTVATVSIVYSDANSSEIVSITRT